MSHSKAQDIRFAYFGSSEISKYALEELEKAGLSPTIKITSAKEPLPMEKLRELDLDVFVVVSFGKIMPDELMYMPKHKTLNMHPSLLPRLRGPAPIQNIILQGEEAGVTIMRIDALMDHGPILAQEKIDIDGIPHYAVLEEILGRKGGALMAEVLPRWIAGEIKEIPQDESAATYTKMVKTEDGLVDLADYPEKNLRKVRAYSMDPGAYIKYIKKNGQEIRVVIKEAEIVEGEFSPTRVIPEGKREMDWQDFLRGNS